MPSIKLTARLKHAVQRLLCTPRHSAVTLICWAVHHCARVIQAPLLGRGLLKACASYVLAGQVGSTATKHEQRTCEQGSRCTWLRALGGLVLAGGRAWQAASASASRASVPPCASSHGLPYSGVKSKSTFCVHPCKLAMQSGTRPAHHAELQQGHPHARGLASAHLLACRRVARLLVRRVHRRRQRGVGRGALFLLQRTATHYDMVAKCCSQRTCASTACAG